MGKPAARLTDIHTCPMVTPGTPPIPHVGGPITGPGAPTVLIGGMPAAVMGDMCVCVGPPDSIVMGSTGVFIGGKPAARMGDPTAHGGVIMGGYPTVLIGETEVVTLQQAVDINVSTPNSSSNENNNNEVGRKAAVKYLEKFQSPSLGFLIHKLLTKITPNNNSLGNFASADIANFYKSKELELSQPVSVDGINKMMNDETNYWQRQDGMAHFFGTSLSANTRAKILIIAAKHNGLLDE